ncbi:hypothetical protein [Streptomyces sp. NPDC001100]
MNQTCVPEANAEVGVRCETEVAEDAEDLASRTWDATAEGRSAVPEKPEARSEDGGAQVLLATDASRRR